MNIKNAIHGLVTLGLGLLLPAAALAQSPNNPYPTKATLLWQTSLDASTYTAPVVGPDGTVYALQLNSGETWALNPGMSLKWAANIAPEEVSSVAVATDGSLIVPGAINSINDGGDCLFSINHTNGTVNWAIPLAAPGFFSVDFFSPPALGPDGTVYIIYGNYKPAGYVPALLAITNGVVAWSNVLTSSTYNLENAPSVGPDGAIYFIDSGNNLNAVNPDGSDRWVDDSSYVSGANGSSPAIGLDGTIYVPTDVGQFVALDTNGVVLWCYSLADTNDFSFVDAPEIGPDGTIYNEVDALVGNGTNYIYALNPNGTLKWTFPILGPSYSEDALYKASSCALASDGEIFVTDGGGFVYSLAPNGTANWVYQTASTGLMPPVIGPEGHLYVSSYNDNHLYCFAGSPVAGGAWPQFRRNARQTGAVALAGVSSPLNQTNRFQFTITGVPNMPVCPFASSDLVNWTNLGHLFINAAGATNYVDPGAGNYPHRFYRAFPQ